MSEELADARVVLVGSTPPPYHGQAVATQLLFDAEAPVFRDAEKIRVEFSGSIDSVGRFGLSKSLHLAKVIWKTWRARMRVKGKAVLYYVPGSASVLSLLKDIFFLCAVRPFFGATVFHFHSGGVSHEVRQSWWGWRGLVKLAFGRPACVIELYPDPQGPGAYFGARRTELVLNGVDGPPAEFSSKSDDDSTFRLLFVGSMRESKGILICLRALAAAQERMSDGTGGRSSGGLHLDLIGSWASHAEEEKFNRELTSLGLEPSVTVHGLQTGADKWRLFAQADAMLFPTHYEAENLPLVIIEAMAARLPVITTRWRGIPTLVDEENGVLIDPRDVDAGAEAILLLKGDRQLSRRLGENGRQRFEEKYTVRRYQERVGGILERELRELVSPSDAAEEVRRDDRVVGEAKPLQVVQVFNRYQERSGEEEIVDAILDVSESMPEIGVRNLVSDSREWKGLGGPPLPVKAFQMFYNPTTVRRIRKLQKEVGVRALICHNVFPVVSPSIYKVAGDLEIPLIQFIHNYRPFSVSGALWANGELRPEGLKGQLWPEVRTGSWQNSWMKSLAVAGVLKFLQTSGWLSAVRKWVACSEFVRDRFLEAGIPRSDIVVIRHGWKAMAELPEIEDKGYYLLIARLVPEKGIGTALEAWRQLEAKLGKACPRLVIAGMGSEGDKAEQAAENSSKISYVGFVRGEQKAELFRRCRAVLAPSVWWEPLGLVTYEAYDYAKPMMAAASGGLTETVEHGVTGLRHRPGDAEDLMRTVLEMEAMSPAERQAMGQRGRDWLLREADYETWIRRLEEVILEVSA